MKGYRKLINPTLIAWGAALLVAMAVTYLSAAHAAEASERRRPRLWIDETKPVPLLDSDAEAQWQKEKALLDEQMKQQRREIEESRRRDAQSRLLEKLLDYLVPNAKAAQPPVAGSDSAIGADAEIVEMARSLRNDPYLIYKYVYDNIEFEPTYGSRKGALGALLDQRANSIDQSTLLVELLRAANTNIGGSWNISYQSGILDLTNQASVYQDWLGVSNLAEAQGVIDIGGIPRSSPLQTSLKVRHIWVKAVIGGNTYVFDPALKPSPLTPGIDLAAATQFSESTFMSRALSGSTPSSPGTGDFVQNMNETNIQADLASAAQNLVDYIKANHPNKTLPEIIGGRQIVPETRTLSALTSQPYLSGSITTWDLSNGDITNAPKSTIHTKLMKGTQSRGDITFNARDVYGRRLSISFNSTSRARINLDGVVQVAAPEASTAPDKLLIEVKHPSNFGNGYYTYALTPQEGRLYVISNSWGRTKENGLIEKRRKWLNDYTTQGIADSAQEERLRGETLNILGATWAFQCDQADRLANDIFNARTVTLHRVGFAGQETAPYVDFQLVRRQTLGLGAGSFNNDAAAAKATGGLSSALEHGAIEQVQELTAVSTVKLLTLANRNHKKIYWVTPTNAATLTHATTGVLVASTLNPDPYEASKITEWTNEDASILLPEQKNVPVDDYSGYAMLVSLENSGTGAIQSGYLIGPGLSGGFSSKPSPPKPKQAAKVDPKPVKISPAQSKDPVELWKGSFLLDAEDLSVGGAELPFGLSFQRTYNSGMRDSKRTLGHGWQHNLEIAARTDSSATQAFGEDSPLDASLMIAGIHAIYEVLKVGRTRDRMLAAAIAQTWLVDQITKNTVSIETAGSTQQFVKMPNGTFNPPPDSADVLAALPGNTGYTLKQKSGIQLTFDAAGKITQWQAPGGSASDNKLTFTYDAGNNNRLQTVVSSYGRTLSLTYDAAGANGRISAVSDGNGRSVSYAYDSAGNLVSSTDLLGYATTYEYDNRHRLLKVFAPEYPTSPFVENIYDSLDRVKEQNNAHGKKSYLYISGVRGEEVDQLGHSTLYEFSHSGKVTAEVDGVGRKVVKEYDGRERLARLLFPEGNTLKYEYDVNHNVTKITQTAKSGCSGSCADIVQEFLYELNPALGHYNKLTQATDALGRVTDYSYFSGTPNLQKVEQPLVGGVRPITQLTYTSKGQLASQTDAEGRVTEYTYNTNGLVTSMVRDAGSGRLNLTESFTYDARGDVATATDARGYTSMFGYDAARQRVSSTTPLVTGTVTPSQSYVTTVKVDKNGRVVETRAATGSVTAPVQVQVQTTVYSKSDKVLASLDPEGNATSFVYDDADRLVEVMDAEGRVTQQTYYDDDRPFETQQLVGGTPVMVRKTTYTENGQVLTVKDGQNTTPTDLTTYGYDGFDRLLTTTYPNGKVESVTYNATGTVATRTTRNNEVFSFAYDALDRLVSKDPPGANNTVVTTYDKTGLVDLVTVNGTSTFDHDYDTAGRLVKVTRPDGKVVEYTVDAGGSRTSVKYPGTPAYTVNTSYDELGRPKEVKENGTTVLASWSYPDRLSGTVTYANATTRAVALTPAGNLTTLTNSLSGEAPQFRHYYNRTGQVTNRRVSVPAYEYSPPGTGSTGYTSNKLNQYTAVASVTHTYNNNGNLTGDGTWTYTYDAENRLLTASKTGTSASYVYDAFGRREQKTVNGTVTKYFLDGGQVLEEYDGSNVRTARYVYAPGIDEPLFMERGGNRYFYHFDGLGSVVALTGTNGAVAERYSYGAYGESQSTSSVGNPYRYTGRELDGETGLYYYRARYYSAGLGRFMQPDPIGYGDGLNLYAYVGNDPINATDPTGTYGWVGAGWGFVSGAIAGGITSYHTSGNSPTGFVIGAITGGLAGGAVGLINPLEAVTAGQIAGSVAGGMLGNIGSTAATQFMAGQAVRPFEEFSWDTVKTSFVNGVVGAAGVAAVRVSTAMVNAGGIGAQSMIEMAARASTSRTSSLIVNPTGRLMQGAEAVVGGISSSAIRK